MTPLGRVELVRDTLPLKPPVPATVSVLALLVAPWLTLMLDGEADRVKLLAVGIADTSFENSLIVVPFTASTP